MEAGEAEFMEAGEYFENTISNRRSIKGNNLCTFGVPYLDREFKGIHPCDFFIVGAYSGVGKTTLMANIAIENASKGKKVYAMFLEGDFHEFGDAQKWRIMCDIYYKEGYKEKRTLSNFNFRAFYTNQIVGIEELERMATDRLKSLTKGNLFIYNKNGNYGNSQAVSNFISRLNGHADLLIMDHLEYFDMFKSNTKKYFNEYAQIGDILKAIMMSVELYRIPVIAVSHIRKKASKKEVIPDREDLKGSSAIFQIPTGVVLIAPYYPEYVPNDPVKPTVIRIEKGRSCEPKGKVASLSYFDSHKRQYLTKFQEREVIWDKDKGVEVLGDSL
jgi:replicative DNA helicase